MGPIPRRTPRTSLNGPSAGPATSRTSHRSAAGPEEDEDTGRSPAPPPRSQQGFSARARTDREIRSFRPDFERRKVPAYPDDFADRPAAAPRAAAAPPFALVAATRTGLVIRHASLRTRATPARREASCARASTSPIEAAHDRPNATPNPNEDGSRPTRAGTRDRDRDRDRMPPHSRAGEPGYVPRRERLRSGDSAFGADIFPPDSEWPDRDAEPDLAGDARPRTGDLAEDDAGSGSGAAPPAHPVTPGPIRGARRRRGRRRERERPGHESAPSSPGEDLAPGFEDLPSDVDSAWSFDRDRAPADEALDDLDELEPGRGTTAQPRAAR